MPPRERTTKPSRKRKLPVDKASRNLNDRMDSAERKRRKTVQRGKKKFSVLFDGKGIERAVCQQINRADTHYVVGCIAWLSNKKILKNLATKRGVCIVCTRDKLTRAHSNQEAYKKLKPAFEGGAIRIVGDGKGWHKSTMHHKFLIGLDGTGKPLWCTNGSFNMTTHALSNLENLMVIDDPDLAEVFLEEFRRVHKISKPLRYRRK